MKKVNIGIIGLGTIGGGVVAAINANGELIAKRTGIELALKGVCDMDKSALKSVECSADAIRTTKASDIINSEEIDIVVELIGGLSPAKEIILEALSAGKHVVTANKALLSESGKEIFETAASKGLMVNFEAAVGGGIPVIKALRESFVANRINVIYGILNGTTNFILSEMSASGSSFEEALSIAQEKGFAEKDPELDVSGADSAHKLALLSLLGFGVNISPEDIYTEGIENIEPQDIQNAERWGYSIKLLAIAKDSPEGLELRVHPTLLRSSHLLSDVSGADNAIFIKGDLVGESLLFGRGAGRKPTASSVVSDVVDIAKNAVVSGGENISRVSLDYYEGQKSVCEMQGLSVTCYLRFSVIDRPGVLAGISSVLAENDISIANVSQEERKEGEVVPVVIVTHKALEGNMRAAIEKIDALDFVARKTVVIRIEE